MMRFVEWGGFSVLCVVLEESLLGWCLLRLGGRVGIVVLTEELAVLCKIWYFQVRVLMVKIL